MYLIILFLIISIFSYVLLMLELESILLIIFASLTMAIFIHGYYLLNQIHNKYVNENKSLSARIIEKRQKIK